MFKDSVWLRATSITQVHICPIVLFRRPIRPIGPIRPIPPSYGPMFPALVTISEEHWMYGTNTLRLLDCVVTRCVLYYANVTRRHKNGRCIQKTRHLGFRMGTIGTAPSRSQRGLGRKCPGQSSIYQRRLLDFANWSTVAGFASCVWRLEEYASSFLPLARQGNLGAPAGNIDR